MLRRKFYININNDYSMIAGRIALADWNPPPPPRGKCSCELCASHLFHDYGGITFADRNPLPPLRRKLFLVWDKDVITFADHNSLPMPIPRQWRRVEPFYQYDLLLCDFGGGTAIGAGAHPADGTLSVCGDFGDTYTAIAGGAPPVYVDILGCGDTLGVEVFSADNLGPYPFCAKSSRIARELFTHFQKLVLSLSSLLMKVYDLQRRISVLTKYLPRNLKKKIIEGETHKKLAINLVTFTTEIQNTTDIQNCVEINQNHLLAEYPNLKQEVAKQIKTIRLLEELRRHRSVTASTKLLESSEISASC